MTLWPIFRIIHKCTEVLFLLNEYLIFSWGVTTVVLLYLINIHSTTNYELWILIAYSASILLSIFNWWISIWVCIALPDWLRCIFLRNERVRLNLIARNSQGIIKITIHYITKAIDFLVNSPRIEIPELIFEFPVPQLMRVRIPENNIFIQDMMEYWKVIDHTQIQIQVVQYVSLFSNESFA